MSRVQIPLPTPSFAKASAGKPLDRIHKPQPRCACRPHNSGPTRRRQIQIIAIDIHYYMLGLRPKHGVRTIHSRGHHCRIRHQRPHRQMISRSYHQQRTEAHPMVRLHFRPGRRDNGNRKRKHNHCGLTSTRGGRSHRLKNSHVVEKEQDIESKATPVTPPFDTMDSDCCCVERALCGASSEGFMAGPAYPFLGLPALFLFGGSD